jgi:hypothetical protein
MTVEINRNFFGDKTIKFDLGKSVAMVTPPIDHDYWLMRVQVSQSQAVVCFPKFGVIGIGFQNEEDWNANLPSSCPKEEIFNHISHNKGNDSIKDEDCIQAIGLLQEAIKALKG